MRREHVCKQTIAKTVKKNLGMPGMAGEIEKKWTFRFTTKVTSVPGPSRKKTFISLQKISKIPQQGPTKVLWKFRASPPKKKELLKKTIGQKKQYTFVGAPFLTGTFFCNVFFETDPTFAVYWSKVRTVPTKPGAHDTLGNGNPFVQTSKTWSATFAHAFYIVSL